VTDLYVSADIESDGPIPGEYAMLSFGLAAAGSLTARPLRPAPPGRSPFGFSGALDMKTMYQQKAGVVLDRAGRRDLPAFLVRDASHTHNALDDAIEQGEVFARLFSWGGT